MPARPRGLTRSMLPITQASGLPRETAAGGVRTRRKDERGAAIAQGHTCADAHAVAAPAPVGVREAPGGPSPVPAGRSRLLAVRARQARLVARRACPGAEPG